jgi:hypothetical protein
VFLAHTHLMNVISRILLCLCAITGATQAQETFLREIYDVKSGSYVEVVSLFGKLPTTGYAPVRVTIANRTSVPASVSLSFESVARGGSHRSGEQKLKSSFSASSPATTVTSTDLLVPVAAMVKDTTYSYGNASHSLSLNMIGVRNGSYTQSNGVSRSFPNLLLSDALNTPNASALDSAAGSKASSYSYSNISFAGKFTPSMMPEDWRAYAGYDGMLLTEKDWLDLSPGARSAILQWNRLGGYLRIYSSNSSTTLNTLGIDDNSSRLLQRGKGTVLLSTIKTDLSLDASATVSDMTATKGVDTQAHSLIDDYSSTTWNLQSELGTKTFHFVMFILVLIAFGILVGPVNLFVFAKSGKRHKLFITTPLISIGASFAMILLIFLQDGLGGKGIRVQWMEITQENGDNNAYVHQEQISRSGVLIGNRFTLTEPTVITPLPLPTSQWTRLNSDSNTDQSYEINFVNKGLLVTGDWFQSRSEQAQLLQSVIPTRARIESRPGGNEAALLSNFDYPLAALYFRGSGNKFWKAHQIAAGKNFLCTECTEADYNDFVAQTQQRLGKSQQEKLKQLAEREGHYIATSSEAPMQETYSSIRWKESHTIITGRVENPEAP